ncbi:hypothetical protein EB118_16610 [bacterium]|nr:hypothetical protein [bacterium]NDC95422.1 hypothetical protein [bacterium]NDD85155.1 hypothetical protein [bacterium]NDG31677.1 hypothetical protein [bacterium]
MLQMSDQIGELAKALSKAQAKMRHAKKDNINPHFKSKYADLASVIDEIREPFAENGLSLVQVPGNDGPIINCTTLIMHESGQWIKGLFGLTPVQSTPQASGSCLTYVKRYSIQSMAGLGSGDDDDGNAASAPKSMGFNSQSNSKDNMDKSFVVTTETAHNRNTPPPATFDKSNKNHLKFLLTFLEQKRNPGMMDALIKRMEGKPALTKVVEIEYAAINPDTPDKDPEDK